MRAALCTALWAGLLLTACSDSPSPTDRGYAALNAGNYAAAREALDEALKGMTAADPEYKRAALGLVKALVPSDGERAAKVFNELAARHPGLVGPRDYRTIGSALTETGQHGPSKAVLRAGKHRYPDDAMFRALIAQVEARAEASGEGGVPEDLRGLGYIGED